MQTWNLVSLCEHSFEIKKIHYLQQTFNKEHLRLLIASSCYMWWKMDVAYKERIRKKIKQWLLKHEELLLRLKPGFNLQKSFLCIYWNMKVIVHYQLLYHAKNGTADISVISGWSCERNIASKLLYIVNQKSSFPTSKCKGSQTVTALMLSTLRKELRCTYNNMFFNFHKVKTENVQ